MAEWLASWTSDRDVNRDPRGAVPVAIDGASNMATYRAVVGVRVLRMRADFYPGYEPKVIGMWHQPLVSFRPFEPYLLMEQSLEFRRSADKPPLTRDQLRAISKEHSTLDEMRKALEQS